MLTSPISKLWFTFKSYPSFLSSRCKRRTSPSNLINLNVGPLVKNLASTFEAALPVIALRTLQATIGHHDQPSRSTTRFGLAPGWREDSLWITMIHRWAIGPAHQVFISFNHGLTGQDDQHSSDQTYFWCGSFHYMGKRLAQTVSIGPARQYDYWGARNILLGGPKVWANVNPRLPFQSPIRSKPLEPSPLRACSFPSNRFLTRHCLLCRQNSCIGLIPMRC